MWVGIVWLGQIYSIPINKGTCEVRPGGPGTLVPRTMVYGRCWISLSHPNCLHRNGINIMNPTYPSPNLNSYRHFAILSLWIIFKSRNCRAPPLVSLIGGVLESVYLSKLSRWFSGAARLESPNSRSCTCLNEVRRPRWCRWHGASWLAEEAQTSRGILVGAQAGNNSCQMIWIKEAVMAGWRWGQVQGQVKECEAHGE